jgi:hypothetical protein
LNNDSRYAITLTMNTVARPLPRRPDPWLRLRPHVHRPLPTHPQPVKHWRYPLKRFKDGRVTIALGILAKDGLVLAADCQVTSTDFMKLHYGKIAYGRTGQANSLPAMLAVTGSGTVSYVDHLQREFIEAFHHSSHESAEAVRRDADGRIEDFQARHVIPFAAYDPHDRPEVSLLFAYHKAGKQALWTTDKNVVTEYFTFAAVGAGAIYAQILLGNLFSMRMSTEEAILLSAYVVFQVKDCIDGCGNETDIVYIKDHKIIQADREKVTSLGQIFREFGGIERELLHSLFAPPNDSVSPAYFSRTIRKLRNQVKRILQPSKPMSSSSSQT